VVAKVRERLAVSKQTTQKFDMERFNLKKIDEVEGKEQYLVEISLRFAAMENLDYDVDINRAWETIRENIKISAKEGLGLSFVRCQNYRIKGKKLNCNGYRIQVK
jgi:hypothetical protein